MLAQSITVAALLAGSALAAPARDIRSSLVKRAMRPYTADMPLHESCNATQREYLNRAFEEVNILAQWGKDYIVTNGINDTLYGKFFGVGDYVSVVGAIDALMTANKQGMLFRCDDIDGNCVQDGWRGHWRGENATSETVICEASYTDRFWLESMCQDNYTVANSSPSYFWASDIAHRMYHLPDLTNDEVGHVDGGDTYADCLNLAQTNGTWTPFNTHTIQYFLLEAYANEVARPGVGCTGEVDYSAVGEHGSAPAATTAASGTPTSSAAQSCHTHADGELHCV